jgi:protein-L-isoaspartate(D-aspartate) O-methyltransferase
MVAELERSGAITTEAVRAAFLQVRREEFVSEIAEKDGLAAVYQTEKALVTVTDSRGVAISSSSATAIMAPMLEALELQPGMSVLEIGAGTGYNAALLCCLVGASGRVVTVDVDADIAGSARRSLALGGYPAAVMVADGRRGCPAAATFDRIVASVSSPEVQRAWFDQLADGGLVEVPLRFSDWAQAVVTFRRHGEMLRSTKVIPGGFMPLRDPLGDSPLKVPSTLSVGATPGHEPLLFLIGPCLERLSGRGRRQILINVLSPGRRVQDRIPPRSAQALNFFLTLHPHPRLVMCRFDDRFGTGIVDLRSQAFAAMTLTDGRAGRIDSWGDGSAVHDIADLVTEWQDLGSPDPEKLKVDVVYNNALRRHHRAWREIHTPSATILLNWITAPLS